MGKVTFCLLLLGVLCLSSICEARRGRGRRVRCYWYTCQKCHVMIHSRYRRDLNDGADPLAMINKASDIETGALQSESHLKDLFPAVDVSAAEKATTWFEKPATHPETAESSEQAGPLDFKVPEDWMEQFEGRNPSSHVHKRSTYSQMKMCLFFLNTKCCRYHTRSTFIGYHVRS